MPFVIEYENGISVIVKSAGKPSSRSPKGISRTSAHMR